MWWEVKTQCVRSFHTWGGGRQHTGSIPVLSRGAPLPPPQTCRTKMPPDAIENLRGEFEAIMACGIGMSDSSCLPACDAAMNSLIDRIGCCHQSLYNNTEFLHWLINGCSICSAQLAVQALSRSEDEGMNESEGSILNILISRFLRLSAHSWVRVEVRYSATFCSEHSESRSAIEAGVKAHRRSTEHTIVAAIAISPHVVDSTTQLVVVGQYMLRTNKLDLLSISIIHNRRQSMSNS